MTADIRDRPRLAHEDILRLNFIRKTTPFIFRRHYRTGLRSHIMAVLDRVDVGHEAHGVLVGKVRWFPKPVPLRMLRIFRTRFENLKAAQEELARVRLVNHYLAPDYVAGSEEFLVDYVSDGRRDMLLCGLQEYVGGEVIDPWARLDESYLRSLMSRLQVGQGRSERVDFGQWLLCVQKEARSFLDRIRAMIREADLVPDLAGVGNLLLTPSGRIRLVDINNISEVSSGSSIPLDDRGYPVCDKSIQALASLQEKVAGEPVDDAHPLYGRFLDNARIREVEAIVRRFHLNMASSSGASSYPQA
ncbi:MAG: hypothetical protein P8165_13545 [Deltaproteobacteria bacterium]